MQGAPIGFLGNSHPGFGFNALFGTNDGGECGMENHRCETLTIDEVLTIATAARNRFWWCRFWTVFRLGFSSMGVNRGGTATNFKEIININKNQLG